MVRPRAFLILFEALGLQQATSFFYNPVLSVLVLSSYRSMQDLIVGRNIPTDLGPPSLSCAQTHNDVSSACLGWEPGSHTELFVPKWKLQQELFRQHLNKAALPQYWSIAEHEAKHCALRLQRDPNNWSDELCLNITRVILGITYDAQDIFATDDECTLASGEFLGHIETLSPGYFGSTSSQAAASCDLLFTSKSKSRPNGVNPKPFYVVKGQKDAGIAELSFAPSLLEDNATDERRMAWLSASIWRRIGYHLDGIANFPACYGCPACRSGFRTIRGNFNQGSASLVLLAPGAIPHRLMEDDEYKGICEFPFPNTWMNGTELFRGTLWDILFAKAPSSSLAHLVRLGISTSALILFLPYCITRCISRDEEMYPDPETFRPERFTEPNTDGQLPLDPCKFAFGVGRRVCPGLDVGDMVLLSNVVIFPATSTIFKGLDENGNGITPSTVPPYSPSTTVPGTLQVQNRAAPINSAARH
ncbi:hypothetical protein BS47DRAFT_1400272 [Hydnum rufescens UP504]|uniref:Cytochrome P450 n=1 Tax=Hydnum rufescens UP504 TaxID=1448309 RepID=A0A9P6DPF7_9AGAM|nr:hypothetical protein BS47DRAFT_1400272 [Hydnum rufescens UP504]